MKDEKFLNDLIQKVQQGHQYKYLYFWGHTPKQADLVDKSCFSQWFPAQFKVEGVEYFTAEHYMMAQKQNYLMMKKFLHRFCRLDIRMKRSNSVVKCVTMMNRYGEKNVLT